MARDYYDILGVGRRATEREIKAAYRRLARQYHPDVTGDDKKATDRFKEITEAYEVLSDPKRRRAYDLFGHPSSNGGGFEFGEGVQGFYDFVSGVFRGRETTGPAPGVDEEVELEVTLREAFEGAQKTLEVELLRPCPDCEGTGAPKGATKTTCPECHGSGKVSAPGPLPFRRTCSRCEGKGQIYEQKCKPCRGRGARAVKERLKVTVPAGVDTGSRLRLKGRGTAGDGGGPPGDLYVRVRVAPDERFERDGEDLWTQVRIPVSEALLGGSVDVPLPNGSARMSVPAGTQGGQVFRLRERGFPALGGKKKRGDLLVTVQVRVPKELDEDAREMVDRLKQRVSDF